MAERRDKTLSYRRAEWVNANPASINLAQCIKQATDTLKSIDDRTIVRENGQHVKLLKIKADRQGGLSLHISIETPGESASVVPTVHATETVDVSTAAPPPNTEFMDGDAFIYINGDHVCLCSTIIRDGAITYFLCELFAKADLRKDATMFALMKVADIDKVKLLNAQGVKEIQLRSTLFEASAHFHKRKNQTAGIIGATAKQIKSVLKKDHDVNNDAIRVILTLRTDGRSRGLQLGEERIEALAVDLLKNQEHDDDFIIVTKSGQRIGPHEIYMKATVSIKSIGKSVERDAAWKELSNFYKTLDAIGALEQ